MLWWSVGVPRPRGKTCLGCSILHLSSSAQILQVSSCFCILLTRLSLLAALSSELQFLLDEKEVSKKYQEKMRAVGMTTLVKFALLNDTRAAIRTLLKDEMGFTTDVDPNARAHHCAFIEAWECAEARSKADREAAATARSTNVPRQLPAGDLLGLRRAFKDQYFKLDDNEAPSDMLVEMRLDMIEKGEQRAESLAQVTAKKEGVDDHTDVSKVLLNGVVRIKKAPKPNAMPHDTEELRRRLRTWGWSWIHAQAKHSSRLSLTGITPQIIYNYIEHLLGDTVHRLAARNHDGTMVSRHVCTTSSATTTLYASIWPTSRTTRWIS